MTFFVQKETASALTKRMVYMICLLVVSCITGCSYGIHDDQIESNYCSNDKNGSEHIDIVMATNGGSMSTNEFGMATVLFDSRVGDYVLGHASIGSINNGIDLHLLPHLPNDGECEIYGEYIDTKEIAYFEANKKAVKGDWCITARYDQVDPSGKLTGFRKYSRKRFDKNIKVEDGWEIRFPSRKCPKRDHLQSLGQSNNPS